MPQEYFRHLKPGDRVSRSQYNKAVDALHRVTHSSRMAYGMRHNSGLIMRPAPIIDTTANHELRGWWPFSSADGDNDISGNARDGLFVSDANTDFDALQLDGTDDYFSLDAQVAYYRSLKTGSISFWFYLAETTANQVVFSLSSGANPTTSGAFRIYYSSATHWLIIYSYPDLYMLSATTYEPHRWHHVMYGTNSSGNSLYIDGQAITPAYSVGSAATNCFFGHANDQALTVTGSGLDCMRVGCIRLSGSNTGFLRGGLAGLRIYNRRLTQDDVIELYERENKYMIHANEMVGACRVFEVQSNATGDGVYNCYAQTLDATEWDDTAGDPKFDDYDTTSVEVLNMAEFDPESEYVRQLAAGDMMVGFRHWDDEYGLCWLGVPFRKDGNSPRIAYCKDDAGAGSTIACYLDTDTTGTEITVNCDISGGSALNAAIRRLSDGDRLKVYKIGANWYALEGFQTIDTNKGLEISSDKLAVAVDEMKGIEFQSGKVAAKLDADEMQFNGSGGIATQLNECS